MAQVCRLLQSQLIVTRKRETIIELYIVCEFQKLIKIAMVSQSSSSTELYNLRWNSYYSNLVSVFSEHQSKETLVDVTLSCEGQFIKAHRLVLAACSIYFQKMFEIHTTPQLIIVLNDVKFKDLQLVIQFMYKGEVKVGDSEMQSFLALGKLLQVKGLCSVELQDKQKSPIIEGKNEKVSQVSFSSEDKTKTPDKKNNSNEQNTQLKETPTVSKKRKLATPPLPPPPLETTTGNKQKKSVKSSSSESQDTSRIPRPPNAFMIFANQWRKKLAVEYPGDSNKDISVRLGNMWKSLSQETKEAFYEDARKADEEHKLKYPGYYYSPKEARNRKAIANITKAAQKGDSIFNIDINESNDDPIEIKCEENGGDDDYDHSTQNVNDISNSN